jgi:hypothetical protein
VDDERCMWKIESGDRIMVRIYMSGAASWPLCVCYAIQPTPLPDGVDTVCSTRRDPFKTAQAPSSRQITALGRLSSPAMPSCTQPAVYFLLCTL